jgi:hypothetical protein
MTMATLREYFGTIPGTTFPMEHELSLAPVDGGSASLVVVRLYADFSSHTRYVSFFIKESEYSFAVAAYLSQNPALVIGQLAESLKISSGHPAVHNSTENSDDLPFSGRVYLFIDQLVPAAEKDQLRAASANVNVALEIRDKEFSEFLSVTRLLRCGSSTHLSGRLSARWQVNLAYAIRTHCVGGFVKPKQMLFRRARVLPSGVC